MCLKSCQRTPDPPQLFMLLFLLFLGCRWPTPASSLLKQPWYLPRCLSLAWWLAEPALPTPTLTLWESHLPAALGCCCFTGYLSKLREIREQEWSFAICSPKADQSSWSEKPIAFYKRARLGSVFQSRSFAPNFSVLFQHKSCESVHDESFTLRYL